MKKKTIALLIAAAALSLTACDSKAEPTESTAETSVEDTAAVSVADEAEETTENAPAEDASGLIGKELPEISGSISGLELKLKGVEMAEYSQKPCLRFYMEATNGSEYTAEPRDNEGYNVFAYQNGEELKSCISSNSPVEEYYWMTNFYPGTTTDVCTSYQLINDTDPVTLKFVWDSGEESYDFDITNVCGAPASLHGLDPVTDTSWFQPASDKVTIFDVEYSYVDVEIVEVYSIAKKENVPAVRIKYHAQNNGEKESYISRPFMPFQDGMELNDAKTQEPADTDLKGADKIQPGESMDFTCVYELYSQDPVFLVDLSVAGLNGVAVNLDFE